MSEGHQETRVESGQQRWLKQKSSERRHRRISTKIREEAKPIDGFWTRNQSTCSLESEEMALLIDDKLDYMMDYVKIERLIKLFIETEKIILS